MRHLIQLAFILRRLLLRLLRVRTSGVKVMLFNEAGQLLLIRNSYGDRNLFLLPGGGISGGESAAQAAVREVREELGLDIGTVEAVATYISTAEGKRDTIHLFRATTHSEAKIDGWEVMEARFFPLDDLPKQVSPATRRRIEELTGRRPIEDSW